MINIKEKRKRKRKKKITFALGISTRDFENPRRAPASVPVVAGVVLVSNSCSGNVSIGSRVHSDHTGGKVLGNVLLEGIINRLSQRVLVSTVGLGVRGNQTHVVEGEHLLGAGVNVVGGINLAKGGDNDLTKREKKSQGSEGEKKIKSNEV